MDIRRVMLFVRGYRVEISVLVTVQVEFAISVEYKNTASDRTRKSISALLT